MNRLTVLTWTKGKHGLFDQKKPPAFWPHKDNMSDLRTQIFRTDQRSASSTLSVVEYGRHEVSHHMINRRLPYCAVVFVEKGEGSLETDVAGSMTIRGPCLFWLFAEHMHSYGPALQTSWTERWALFQGSLVEDFRANRLITSAQPIVQLVNASEVAHTFSQLLAEMSRRDALGQAAAAASIHRLVIQSATQARMQRNKRSDAKLTEITEAIKERAFDGINFEELAREFDMSPITLRRKCITASGLPPKSLQLQLRMERAKELLTSTDLSIEDIAAEIGYEDAFYFSRMFFKRENCAPRDFRKLHARN